MFIKFSGPREGHIFHHKPYYINLPRYILNMVMDGGKYSRYEIEIEFGSGLWWASTDNRLPSGPHLKVTQLDNCWLHFKNEECEQRSRAMWATAARGIWNMHEATKGKSKFSYSLLPFNNFHFYVNQMLLLWLKYSSSSQAIRSCMQVCSPNCNNKP